MTKEILLTQGKVALVDDEDFEELNMYKWYATQNHPGKWYAARARRRDEGKRGIVRMHIQLMGGGGIDHIDLDGLNNQRTNLRFATTAENGQNTRKQSNNTSGWKGVTFHKPSGKWVAKIMADRKHMYIGYFDTPEEGARAYDMAAIKCHGEFARLNYGIVSKDTQ